MNREKYNALKGMFLKVAESKKKAKNVCPVTTIDLWIQLAEINMNLSLLLEILADKFLEDDDEPNIIHLQDKTW